MMSGGNMGTRVGKELTLGHLEVWIVKVCEDLFGSWPTQYLIAQHIKGAIDQEKKF